MIINRPRTEPTAPFERFALVVPAAHLSVAPSVVTPGRLLGSAAVVVALVGVVLGGLASTRSAGGRDGRRGAVVALTAGPAGMIMGGLVVAAAKGGPGTGYGVVGGYAALAIGLIATGLGVLALIRARRTA